MFPDGYGGEELVSELSDGCTGMICGRFGSGRTVLRKDPVSGDVRLGDEDRAVQRVRSKVIGD